MPFTLPLQVTCETTPFTLQPCNTEEIGCLSERVSAFLLLAGTQQRKYVFAVLEALLRLRGNCSTREHAVASSLSSASQRSLPSF